MYGSSRRVDDPFNLGATEDQYSPAYTYIQEVNDSFMPSGQEYERQEDEDVADGRCLMVCRSSPQPDAPRQLSPPRVDCRTPLPACAGELGTSSCLFLSRWWSAW